MNRIFGITTVEKYLRLSAFIGGLFLCCSSFNAQDLPREIRGYKVERVKISVKNEAEKTDAKDKSDAFVKVSEPRTR